MDENQDTSHKPKGWFTPTHWSVVLDAKESGSRRNRDALQSLCQTYWPPLFVYVRRKGYSEHDAQDLIQEYFSRLLAKNYLDGVDRKKGKFRSFLLASLEHFLAKEWRHKNAVKRGRRVKLVSLDFASEAYCAKEPADPSTPIQVFERRWALILLDRGLTRVEQEYTLADNQELFQQLKGFISGDPRDSSYAQAATNLGMKEGAIRTAAHRLRQRYREALRFEIGQTVASEQAIDDEIRYLFSAFAKK